MGFKSQMLTISLIYEEGIEIPWPHTKVYFGNAPGENGEKGKSLPSE